MMFQIARAATAVVLCAAASVAVAAECEQNFSVAGGFTSGRTYATEAHVPEVTYLPALYRVRDKIQEQGLHILAVQEKNGYIRAANEVTGGEGGTANAPLRVYVTPQDGGGVKVSLQFTIAGGQMTSKKAVMRYMCEIVDAAAAAPAPAAAAG